VIAKLYLYFGNVGCASIGVWLMSALMAVVFVGSRRRTFWWCLACVFALLGLALAKVNSTQVTALKIDRTEEKRKAEEERIRRRKEQLQSMIVKTQNDPTRIRFAEDTPYDALDLAGKEPDSVDDGSVYAKAVAEQLARKTYGYQKPGKSKRAEGTRKGSAELQEMAAENAAKREVRKLPEKDVISANRVDSLNLVCARAMVVLTICLALVDYLSHFNRTFSTVIPLPLAGPWMDAFSPKRHTTLITGNSSRALANLLSRAFRKGESFIYFGPNDPAPETLTRFSPVCRGFRRHVRKLVFDSDHSPSGPGLVLESAWHGRNCVAIHSREEADIFVEYLVWCFLDTRSKTRARARRTMVVVWDFDTPVELGTLQRLAFLSRKTNCKLVMCCPEPPGEEVAELFEECRAT
jgi:hypothetical protein